MGAMVPPSRKSCYNFRVTKIVKVLDGDTIDVLIDLGFDLYKKERVRIAGVDTPEKRTRDKEEKVLGIHATNWMKDKLTETRLLGWLYVGDATLSLNEQMITEGYAWAYDGGTKQKNFEELREIRRSFGTLEES
jgi:endonuclease YncB( thermonuclease family)